MSGWPNTAFRVGGPGFVLHGLQSDILCIQETKMAPSQLTTEIACPLGYQSYWHFNMSTKRLGYSGVAIYVRHELAPSQAQAGLSHASSNCFGDRLLPAALIAELDKEMVHTSHCCSDLDAEGVSCSSWWARLD